MEFFLWLHHEKCIKPVDEINAVVCSYTFSSSMQLHKMVGSILYRAFCCQNLELKNISKLEGVVSFYCLSNTLLFCSSVYRLVLIAFLLLRKRKIYLSYFRPSEVIWKEKCYYIKYPWDIHTYNVLLKMIERMVKTHFTKLLIIHKSQVSKLIWNIELCWPRDASCISFRRVSFLFWWS